MDSIWSYEPEPGPAPGQAPDLTGYTVVASDGGTIGRVARQAAPHSMRHLVVDTGLWVFGRSLLVPVGVVATVDSGGRRVTVSRTKSEVKAAPRFRTDSETMDPGYLATVGEYYGGLVRPESPPEHTSGTPAG